MARLNTTVCLQCGAPLGFLSRMTGEPYCSREHRAEHRLQRLAQAIGVVEERGVEPPQAAEESIPAEPPAADSERQPAEAAAPAAAGFRSISNACTTAFAARQSSFPALPFETGAGGLSLNRMFAPTVCRTACLTAGSCRTLPQVVPQSLPAPLRGGMAEFPFGVDLGPGRFLSAFTRSAMPEGTLYRWPTRFPRTEGRRPSPDPLLSFWIYLGELQGTAKTVSALRSGGRIAVSPRIRAVSRAAARNWEPLSTGSTRIRLTNPLPQFRGMVETAGPATLFLDSWQAPQARLRSIDFLVRLPGLGQSANPVLSAAGIVDSPADAVAGPAESRLDAGVFRPAPPSLQWLQPRQRLAVRRKPLQFWPPNPDTHFGAPPPEVKP